MKKGILIGAAVVVVGGIAAVVLLGSNLGKVVKAGIEAVGPKLTQAPVTVESVDLSPSSGAGTIRGLVVGNPAPYKEPVCLTLGEVSLAVDPGSLLSDKVVVKSIRIVAPEITLEGGLGDNNLKQLLANVDKATGGGGGGAPAESAGSGSGKKVQVDEFVLSGAKVTLKLNIPGVGGALPTLTLPDIRLSGLGTGTEGITVAALTRQVLSEVTTATVSAATKQAGALGKFGAEAAKAASGKATDTLKSAKGALDGLLKGK